MAIFIGEQTRLVVQGITGRDGSFHTRQMIEYGTRVVAGVTPGKGGLTFDGTVPVYNTVVEAVVEQEANASVIYVPARFAGEAILEAADAGIELIVCITEGIPVAEMMRVMPFVQERGARLIGPNCPGLIVPGVCKVGILPGQIVLPGRIGIVSRSGTLTYEIIFQLTSAGIGQSTSIGIGGDPIIGTDFVDCLRAFEADGETDAVVIIGEIGGTDEQTAASLVKEEMNKPVVGFIAGQTAPPGRRMGHAGAIISGSEGTAAEKVRAFQENGIAVAERPVEIVDALRAAL
jgi:succinyl-CoA synthetase alpha subunit